MKPVQPVRKTFFLAKYDTTWREGEEREREGELSDNNLWHLVEKEANSSFLRFVCVRV
jgi:hypothetical protein